MNVIVICIDTLRADIVGPSAKLGFVETPNMDGFAARGVTFSQAYGSSQPTLQMRRSVFTGMRSFPFRWNFDRRGHTHHAAGWHKIPPSQDTLSEILVSRGYMTGLVTDTYHMFKPTMNYTRGFLSYDFTRGQEFDSWRGGTPEMVRDQLARCTRDPDDLLATSGLARYFLNMRGREKEEDYLCAQVFCKAAGWLDDNHTNRPFYLWVDSFDPHEPWDPPADYLDKYSQNYTGLDPVYPQFIRDLTPRENERAKALYFGEVTLVDRWVGHLLAAIDRHALWEDTLVILTSDHGTQLLDHGRFGKDSRHLHPYNTRINCIVRHPAGPQGKQVSAFIQANDIAATILGALGIEHPMHGIDAWPLVTGEREQIRDHVVSGWAGFNNGPAVGHASVRDREWNYIIAVGEHDPDPRLFHLAEDPEEKTNVVADYPEVVEKQRNRLQAVLGGAPEAPQLEVCDLAPSPDMQYLAHKLPREQVAAYYERMKAMFLARRPKKQG